MICKVLRVRRNQYSVISIQQSIFTVENCEPCAAGLLWIGLQIIFIDLDLNLTL